MQIFQNKTNYTIRAVKLIVFIGFNCIKTFFMPKFLSLKISINIISFLHL